MSNAAKYRKKAAEFEGLKQIDRAVSMYVSAIQESEKSGEDVDVALLNKVGDLTLRQGRIADAVVYYERAVEHYATAGLFNNAIALCNKILRSAPGRSNVYYTLGRICVRKGLRGDATRNFLEYASRMREDGRLEEGMRALAEIADLMPELTEVRGLVEEHAARNGITLPARRTPLSASAQRASEASGAADRSLVFLDIDYDAGGAPAAAAPSPGAPAPTTKTGTPHRGAPARPTPASTSLDDVMLFDPSADADEGFDEDSESDPASLSVDGLTSAGTGSPAAGSSEPAPLDGFMSSADLGIREPDVAAGDTAAARRVAPTDPALTWLVEPPAGNDVAEGLESDDLELLDGTTVDGAVPPIDGLTSHGSDETVEASPLDGFEATADGGGFDAAATATDADAPAPLETTEKEQVEPVAPLDGVEPVPELDAAIAAGQEAVARGEGLALPQRPRFRLAPHAFVQAGELPPLRLGDVPADRIAVERAPAGVGAAIDAAMPVDEMAPAADTDSEPVEAPASEPREHASLRTTPSVPISAVAAEANAVATSRRDALRAAVAADPRDWRLRRRLAEALFEAGERDAALAELTAALNGHADADQVAEAADIADELVQVAPDRVPFHQRRVEMAVRLHDNARLQIAYLDLADALVQGGDEGRARAVYARVLEMDPRDDRARTALGSAAPPLPETEPERPDDKFVDLASWLNDDGEGSTRMRMREPVASGDEQADFDALLRHFREGVSRSLGEEDYESHYDLGVAYKEMGLLDDAIAEFQKALRSRSHRLPAYEALGQCFVEQERYQVASTVLSRALHEPGLTDEARVGVLYLLAISSEALERWAEARSYYQRVYATDIHFRDVAARLAVIDQGAR